MAGYQKGKLPIKAGHPKHCLRIYILTCRLAERKTD